VNVTYTKRGSLDLGGLADDVRDGARTAGRLVARDAGKLIMANARVDGTPPRFAGKRLNVRARVYPATARTEVVMYGTSAGAWTILEYGRRGNYTVRPRRRRVLSRGMAGPVYGTTARPGPVTARRSWSRATADLDRQLEPLIVDAVDEALGV
jgi:hypothetical protein